MQLALVLLDSNNINNKRTIMNLPHCQELIIKVSEGVLTITLNRPHKKNAMNLALVEELMSVVEEVKNERAIRVIVIRGAENIFILSDVMNKT